jgi:hypothetical protein
MEDRQRISFLTQLNSHPARWRLMVPGLSGEADGSVAYKLLRPFVSGSRRYAEYAAVVGPDRLYSMSCCPKKISLGGHGKPRSYHGDLGNSL